MHTHTHLPQGWGCQDTLPGPDGAAGYGSGRSGPVCPNTPFGGPCCLMADGTVRRQVQQVFAEWLWSWEEQAALIEQRWAWTGLVPILGPAPPSAPPLLGLSRWFILWFSHTHARPLYLSFTYTYRHTHTLMDTRPHGFTWELSLT